MMSRVRYPAPRLWMIMIFSVVLHLVRDDGLSFAVNAKSGGGGYSRSTSRGGPPSSRPSSRGVSRRNSSNRRNFVDGYDSEDIYDEEIDSGDDEFEDSVSTTVYDEPRYDDYDDEDGDSNGDVRGILNDEYDVYDSYDEVVPLVPLSRPSSGRPSSGRNKSSRKAAESTKSRSMRSANAAVDSKKKKQNNGKSFKGNSKRRGGQRSSRMVPYARNHRALAQQPSAFTRGFSAIRESIPDAATIKESAMHSIASAKETTTKLSANIYREVKGHVSSELEQVILKATRPDDSPAKGKHVERLVGITYGVPGRHDIYEATLKKLWNRMAENDWRTTLKALYILHRYSAHGAPGHQAALKARLREFRRTRDPKRKGKYFATKVLLAGNSPPNCDHYRAFLLRYSHYVLLRAQCFGGMFTEIDQDSRATNQKSKSSPSRKTSTSRRGGTNNNSVDTEQHSKTKPVTFTSLNKEYLDSARLLLKAGVECAFNDGEECLNTAIALERVVSDLIGLTTAVAKALDRALRAPKSQHDFDAVIIQKWCDFYSKDLLPCTKNIVKKNSVMLDGYGLHLPARMGATVSHDLLQKGLMGVDESNLSEKTKQEQVKPHAVTTREEERSSPGEDDDIDNDQNNITGDVDGERREGDEGNGKHTEKTNDDEQYDVYDYEYYDEEV